jgi:hypothetical protein
VQDHIAEAQSRGSVEINGAKAQILEWKVPEADLGAFDGFNALTEKGGILRVFVLPQLGYVLPRVQCLGPTGQLGKSFDCSDFAECRDGIFIPKKLGKQVYDAHGPGYHERYEITKIESINQAIPDADFVVQLPLGTGVSDRRPGNSQISFNLDEDQGIPEGLNNLLAVNSPSFWGRNWQTAVIVGAGLGLLLIVSYYGFRKGRPKKART